MTQATRSDSFNRTVLLGSLIVVWAVPRRLRWYRGEAPVFPLVGHPFGGVDAWNGGHAGVNAKAERRT